MEHLDVLIEKYKEKEKKLNKPENKKLKEIGEVFLEKRFKESPPEDILESIQDSLDALVEYIEEDEPILEFDGENKAFGQIILLAEVICWACVYANIRKWNLGLAIELLKESFQ